MSEIEHMEFDLGAHSILLHFKNKPEPLVLFFDTPSRKFYFSFIALIVTEIKARNRSGFLHIQKYDKLLRMLDHSLAGRYASKNVEDMWGKLRKAWRDRLPDLETAPLFKLKDRDIIQPYEKGGRFKYECSEDECDVWANLFQYDENNKWRYKFAIEAVSLNLKDIRLNFEDLSDKLAWKEFVGRLQSEKNREKNEDKNIQEKVLRTWKRLLAPAMILLAIFSVLVLLYNRHFNYVPSSNIIELTDRPSIAVMPFVNLGDGPDHEYFCDGMTDSIITDLSKVSDLFVIARNSSFIYKGKPVKVQEVAENLGVQFVLEGSVQRMGDSLRINVQLIDGRTGHHIWADRYDRKVKDVFAVQDDIAQKVVSELSVTLRADEHERLWRKHTTSLEAYDLYLRARYERLRRKKDNLLKGIEIARRAIEVDPGFAGGYSELSLLLGINVIMGYSTSPNEDLDKSFKMAQKAVSVDDTFAFSWRALSGAYRKKGQWDEALNAALTAVRIEPGGYPSYLGMGFLLHLMGRGEEAVEAMKKAQELHPKYLSGRDPGLLTIMGYSYFTAGKYEEAIATMKKRIKTFGFYVNAQAFLTASYSELGRVEEAKAMAVELLRHIPDFSLSTWRYPGLYKNSEDTERLLNAMRKAGLK